MIQKVLVLLLISLSFLATSVAEIESSSQDEVIRQFEGYEPLFEELLNSDTPITPKKEELRGLQQHYKVVLPSEVPQLQSFIDEIYKTALNTRLGVNICSLFNGNVDLVSYYLGNESDVCLKTDSDPNPFYVEKGEPKNIDDANFSKRTFLFLIPKTNTKELGFSSYTTYPENVTSIILDPQLLKAASEGEPLPFILELIKTLTHEMAIILDRKQRFDELYLQYENDAVLKLNPGMTKYFQGFGTDIFFALRNPLVNISLAAIRAFEVENTILLDIKTQNTNLGQHLKHTQFISSYDPGNKSCVEQISQISEALKTSQPHILSRAYGFIHYLSEKFAESRLTRDLSSLFSNYIISYFKLMELSNFNFDINKSEGNLYNPIEKNPTQHKNLELLKAQGEIKFSMLSPDLNFSKLPNIFQENSWKEYQKFTLNILKEKRVIVDRKSIFRKETLDVKGTASPIERKRAKVQMILNKNPHLQNHYSYIMSHEEMMDVIISKYMPSHNNTSISSVNLCKFLSEPLLSLVYTDTSRGPRPRIGTTRPRISPIDGRSGPKKRRK